MLRTGWIDPISEVGWFPTVTNILLSDSELREFKKKQFCHNILNYKAFQVTSNKSYPDQMEKAVDVARRPENKTPKFNIQKIRNIHQTMQLIKIHQLRHKKKLLN